MIGLIVFGSLVTSVAIISILAKASPKLLKRVLGYEAYVDLAFSLLIGMACGFSGTMSGFVIGAATGLIFGVTLFILARVYGYACYEKQEDGTYKWVEYEPKFKISNWLSKYTNKNIGKFA
jgi:hypothetical protein